ncbi:MAG: hypothetical protein FJ164_08220 [Gammaproteobacteria bacterium]|nr:hypothetical protein [Gammaproteobacteria bacterium]
MALFDQTRFLERVNQDGEFQIAARYLNGALKLFFGEESLLLTFRDGRLASLVPGVMFDSAEVTIRGPVASWQEFLKPVPRPFFHDMFAAIVSCEFEWFGSSETFFAYYGAYRRMFQLMRECAA